MEKDSFRTCNQNLIKICMNTKGIILTIWAFPHSLPFVFSKISLWKGPYLFSAVQLLVQQVGSCWNFWALL